LVNVAAHRLVAGEGFVMQTIGVVILTVAGMALYAGLSVILYMALPQSVLDCSAHHGRFAGFEYPERADRNSSGKVSVTSFEVLQGQTA
jgi:hypothetical protein